MANQQQQNSGGVFTVTSGVTGVKGAWAPGIASTNFVAKWIWIALGSYTNAGTELVQIDIGTGAAGVEVADYADSYFFFSNSATQPSQNIFLPVNIPAGSRISLRIETTNPGAPIVYRVNNLMITDIPMPKGSPVNTLILPRTLFTPLNGTDGPIVEVIDVLPHKLDYMIILAEHLAVNFSSVTNWDLMTGSSGTEFDRMGEMGIARIGTFVRQLQSVAWCGPVAFDAGERLSCRGKQTGGSINTLVFQAVAWEYPVQ
jgi:hypothetical protein